MHATLLRLFMLALIVSTLLVPATPYAAPPAPVADQSHVALRQPQGQPASTSVVCAPRPTPPPGWFSHSSLPTPRFSMGIVAASDGKIYVIGGSDGTKPLSSMVVYDPNRDEWTTSAAPMSVARSGLGATQAPNGFIYAIGGKDSNGAVLNTVEFYNPISNTWVITTSMPTARMNLGVATAKNGKIYAIGGVAGGPSSLNTVEEFNPVTGNWATRANMISTRANMGVVASHTGKIYTIGGLITSQVLVGNAQISDIIQSYDPNLDQWTTVNALARMPTKRYGLGASEDSNGRLLAIAGYDGQANQVTGLIEIYDPSTNLWSTSADTIPASYLLGVASVGSGIFAVGGSTTQPFKALDSVVASGSTPNIPVVLVHGYRDDASSWNDYVDTLLPSIGRQGCAIAQLNTGKNSSTSLSVEENGQRLGGFINSVLLETGAQQVDVVAHSMGGLITRAYINNYMPAHAPTIRKLIMLGTPNGGSFGADIIYGAHLLGLPTPQPYVEPATRELTQSFASNVFNVAITNQYGVSFYNIAGSLDNCQFIKPSMTIAGIIEGAKPNDGVVKNTSAFAIPLDGRWLYTRLNGSCEGEHTGMRSLAANNGGQPMFDLYVTPLLQGISPVPPMEPAITSNRSALHSTAPQQFVASASPIVQLTNIKAETLQPNGHLEFPIASEQGSDGVFRFLAIGNPEQMRVSLRSPSGQLFTSTTSDPMVQYGTTSIFPMALYQVSSPTSGIWTLVIDANQQTPPTGIAVAVSGHVLSNTQLTPVAPLAVSPIQKPLAIQVQLNAAGQPLLGATLQANLHDPAGVTSTLTLYDDGQHNDGAANDGLYGNTIVPTIPGLYESLIAATGSSAGQLFTRTALWMVEVTDTAHHIYLPSVIKTGTENNALSNPVCMCKHSTISDYSSVSL